jgi:hypothetical protein
MSTSRPDIRIIVSQGTIVSDPVREAHIATRDAAEAALWAQAKANNAARRTRKN